MDRFMCGQTLDRLRELPDGLARCVVTSPPYWGLRDYGVDGQIGLEETPEEYVARLVEVFTEVRRVLADDGTLWLNLGDSYIGGGGYAPDAPCNKARTAGDSSAWGALNPLSVESRQARRSPKAVPVGLKPKDLVGMPWRMALALQAAGWWLRADIVWSRTATMPDGATDRPTRSHEYVFLMSKSRRYHYNAEAVAVPRADGAGTRNLRSVWRIAPASFRGAHFAVMPLELAQTCVLAGSSIDDVVLDPFGGAGTTALAARLNGRRFVHIDLNPDYVEIAERRLADEAYQPGLFGGG